MPCSWRPRSPQRDQPFNFPFWFLTLVSELCWSQFTTMTKTWSNSQNTEKITTMSKVLDCHEQTLQEIQKQLQTLNSFMQRIAENEERHLNSPNNGSRTLQIGNTTNLESSPVCTIENWMLDFPQFDGADPTCWIYKTNQLFSFHGTC